MAAALLVLFIAERTGAARITLVLAGVAISNVLAAGVDAVVTFAPDALNAYSDFRIGSLENLTMGRLAAPAAVTAVALIAAFSLTNELDVLMLGGDTAQSLGLNAGRMRIILLAVAAALAGAAVSFAGLLGFVGLVTPHIIRRFTLDEARCLLPASALGGASLLLVCDTASRHALCALRAARGHHPGLYRRAVFHLAAAEAEKGAYGVIELRNLWAGYHGEDVLRGVSLRFEAGKVSVLCGPNGCGKSTLLKAALA